MLKILIRVNVGVYIGCLVALFALELMREPLPVSWDEMFWLASSANIDVLVERPWTMFTLSLIHI